MKIKICAALAASLFVLTAVSTFAHHPFSDEFDWKKPVTISGTVTKFEWMNPHSVLYVDGKDDSGKAMQWTLELGGPNTLGRAGWSKTSVKAGDKITVDGWSAKNKAGRASVKSVKLPNGQELAGGSSILEIGKKTNTATN